MNTKEEFPKCYLIKSFDDKKASWSLEYDVYDETDISYLIGRIGEEFEAPKSWCRLILDEEDVEVEHVPKIKKQVVTVTTHNSFNAITQYLNDGYLVKFVTHVPSYNGRVPYNEYILEKEI
jgi:hypothetical protein